MLDIAQQKKLPPLMVCPSCRNEAVYQWGDSLHFEDGDYCVKCWNVFVKAHTSKMVEKPQPEVEAAPAAGKASNPELDTLRQENASLKSDIRELISIMKRERGQK